MQGIPSSAELPPQIPLYICLCNLTSLLQGKRAEGEGPDQVQALQLQHTHEEAPKAADRLRRRVISLRLINYNMDFSALTNSVQINNIDRISVNFLDRLSFETAGKINDTAKRRFIDNLFYSFANCSLKVTLVDRVHNTSRGGPMSQLAELMNDFMAQDKDIAHGRTLDVVLESALAQDATTRQLVESYPFIRPYLKEGNFGLIKDSVVAYLHTLCEKYEESAKDAGKSDGDHGFEKFVKGYHLEPASSSAETKFELLYSDLNSQFESFKAKMAALFPVANASTLDEVSSVMTKQMQKFYKGLSNLSKDIVSASKHSNYSKLKHEFDVVQKALKGIIQEVRPREASQNAKAENAIHFEDREERPEVEEELPFCAFYRVKSVLKHRRISKMSRRNVKNSSIRSIRTQELGNSELGSSDTVSYHICDQEGNTVSQLDERSDDGSARLSNTHPQNVLSSELRLIKKNQSLNQFISRESSNEHLIKTVTLEETSGKNHPGRESIILGLPNPRVKSLEAENSFLRSKLSALQINIDGHVDEIGGGWKVKNEEELERKLKSLLDLINGQEAVKGKISGLEATIKLLTEEIEEHKERQKSQVPLETLSELKEELARASDQTEKLRNEHDQLLDKFNSLSDLAEAAKLEKQNLEAAYSAYKGRIKVLESNLRAAVKALLGDLRNSLRSVVVQTNGSSQQSSLISKLKQALRDQRSVREDNQVLRAQIEESTQAVEEMSSRIKAYRVLLDESTADKRLLKASIERLFERADACSSVFSAKSVDLETRCTRNLETLKFLAAGLSSVKTQDRQSLKDMEKDNSDLKFINGNLVKELQILSMTQQLLTREKESLEELLRQKEEVEERNKELALTIKMLEEKLEMSNSLREIAERKFQTSEEVDKNGDKSGKNQQDIYNHEFNFHRHLGTIDENEELIEISDTHEPSTQFRETHLASVTEERFQTIDEFASKIKKFEIMKSYSLNFKNSAMRDSQQPHDASIQMQHSANQDFLSPKLAAELRTLAHSEFVERLGHSGGNDKPVSDAPEAPTRALVAKGSYEESRNLKERAFAPVSEKRSSGKKSLFSMENVLKSIGEANKTDLRGSLQKPPGELSATEEQRNFAEPKPNVLRGSINVQEDPSTSNKSTQEPTLATVSPSPLRPKAFEPPSLLASFQKSKEKVKKVISNLNGRFDNLNAAIDEQKARLANSIKSLKDKLINLELLQNIHLDILSVQRENHLDDNLFRPPVDPALMSLTDRMKLMAESREPGSETNKLFGKPRGAEQPFVIARPNADSKALTLNALPSEDNKLSQFAQNLDDKAFKSKTLAHLEKQQAFNFSKIQVKKNSLAGVASSRKEGPPPPPIARAQPAEESPKQVRLMSSDDLVSSEKKSSRSSKGSNTPNSTVQLERITYIQSHVQTDVYDQPEEEGGAGGDDEERQRSHSSNLSNVQPGAEFEIVDRQNYKALLSTYNDHQAELNALDMKHKEEAESLLNEIDQLKAVNDSLKIEALKQASENAQLSDSNSEFRAILERAFDMAKVLLDDTEENEVMMKPEYIDKLLEIVKVKFDNFQLMIEAMDEEIKMLKHELFPSENQYTEYYEGGSKSDEDEQSDPAIAGDSNRRISKRFTSKKHLAPSQRNLPRVFEIKSNDFQSNTESHVQSNKVSSSREVNENSFVTPAPSYKDYVGSIPHFGQPQSLREAFNDIYPNARVKEANLIKIDDDEGESSKDRNSPDYNIEESNRNSEDNRGQTGSQNAGGEDDDPNNASFSQKQRILKEGFFKLLDNIMAVIDSSKNLVAKALTKLISSNSEPSIARPGSKAEPFVPSSQIKLLASLNKQLQGIKSNNLNLAEMVEFLTKNLMAYLEELEELKSKNRHFFQNPPVEDLVAENEFLYQKLTEALNEGESLKKVVEAFHEKYPETRNVMASVPRKSVSMPALKVELDVEDADLSTNRALRLQHKIKELIEFKESGYKSQTQREIPNLKRNLQSESSKSHRVRLITDKASVGQQNVPSTDPASQVQDPYAQNEAKLEELENYNIFLMNILRQIKIIIDDEEAEHDMRFSRLEEISKDLDIMQANKGDLRRRRRR